MIKFLPSLFFICCLSFFYSIPVAAVEQADFFSASVPVLDRSQEVFKQGLRDALVEVLAKASAESPQKIKESSRLAVDLARGDQLASQFMYFTRRVAQNGNVEQDVLYLKASFPEKIVTDLLQMANLRFWPNNRPQILLWPVIKRGDGAQIASISNINDANLIKKMSNKAEYYGLPWMLGESSDVIRPDQFWQWSEADILAVSKKYNTDVILVSRLGITSDNRGMGGWLLIDGSKQTKIDVNTKTLEEFIDRGMSMAAKKLAARYAVKLSAEDNEIILLVDRIDSDAKYQALIAYLENLNIVERVYLLSANGKTLRLAITLKADIEQMQKVLAQHRKLLSDSDAESSAYQLMFYWNE